MIRAGAAKVTRSNLVRLGRRLAQVEKGAALLQRKRDALVLQLFACVRPTIEARRRVELEAAHAYRALLGALASTGRAELAVLGWPSREVAVEAIASDGRADAGTPERFALPRTLARSAAARGLVPGHADPAAAAAAQDFERLLELVLATAPEEFAVRRLSHALAHTMRRVNVLERIVAVDLAHALTQVRRTLDEREREEALRLRRIAARRRAP